MFTHRLWPGAIAAALLMALPFAAARAQSRNAITVFAAASLSNVLQDVGLRYQAATGNRVIFSFAGSMILAKQIEASAGADIFISADRESMDYIEAKNLIARPTRVNLLGNSLVLIAPRDSRIALRIAPGFKLAEALNGGRLAIANVDTVPAGRYGKAALIALGAWEPIKDHLAQGEDVRATLAYVARGEAPLGIVYATDARIEPRVRQVAIFPQNTHEPIIYPAALTRDAKPGAAAFLAYLTGSDARAIFQSAGFAVPGTGAAR